MWSFCKDYSKLELFKIVIVLVKIPGFLKTIQLWLNFCVGFCITYLVLSNCKKKSFYKLNWHKLKKPKHAQQLFSAILIYLSVVLRLTLTFRIVKEGEYRAKGWDSNLKSLIGEVIIIWIGWCFLNNANSGR